MESRNLIRNYIEEFRHEILKILGKKYDDFTENVVQTLYYELLEKYKEKTSKANNINEAMKSKDRNNEWSFKCN